MQRRGSGYVVKMFSMELPGRRKRVRQQMRFMDVVKKDKQKAGMTEEDARDGVWLRWR